MQDFFFLLENVKSRPRTRQGKFLSLPGIVNLAKEVLTIILWAHSQLWKWLRTKYDADEKKLQNQALDNLGYSTEDKERKVKVSLERGDQTELGYSLTQNIESIELHDILGLQIGNAKKKANFNKQMGAEKK